MSETRDWMLDCTECRNCAICQRDIKGQEHSHEFGEDSLNYRPVCAFCVFDQEQEEDSEDQD